MRSSTVMTLDWRILLAVNVDSVELIYGLLCLSIVIQGRKHLLMICDRGAPRAYINNTSVENGFDNIFECGAPLVIDLG
jgi:hypothetical protein